MTMRMARPSAGAGVQYDAWRRREMPPVEQVRPGIWSIPTVIPDNPLRYVIAYLIATSRGAVLVDTGWDSNASWDGLVSGIRLTGHDLADIHDVLLTHSHFDHHGLTRRVVEVSGATVHMHSREARGLEDALRSTARGENTLDQWLIDQGAPASDALALAEGLLQTGVASAFALMVPADRRLEDGDRPIPELPDLSVIWTPGHTEGHLCFLLEKDGLLISGDHVLPRITPHVSRAPGAGGNPLGDYLGSLSRVADLSIDEVLPAHEYRFVGLQGRVADMIAHHELRLNEIETAAARGSSTWTVATEISWSRGWDSLSGVMRQTALSETLAHLTFLESVRRVRRISQQPDRWDIAV